MLVHSSLWIVPKTKIIIAQMQTHLNNIHSIHLLSHRSFIARSMSAEYKNYHYIVAFQRERQIQQL